MALNGSLNESTVRDIFEEQFGHLAPETETTMTMSLLFLYIPAFLAGLIGNGLIILIIASKRRLRNGTNLFLCNLAVADLCVTVICIPVAVGGTLYKIWLYGEFMCKLTSFLQCVTVAASVFTITLLGIDRFLAIRHPIVFKRLSTNTMAIKLILVVWVISIALMIPLFVVGQLVQIIPGKPVYICVEIWPGEEEQRLIYDICLFIIVYIIPGLIVCTCYGLIGSELWREDKNLKRTESETSQGISKQIMKGRKRVAKMLIALAVLFAVCWLPYYCVNLYIDFSADARLVVALHYTIFLGHLNSALNPLLYFYSSKSFRCVLVRMFKCNKRRFTPERQGNMIVRCTRNNAGRTTAALTRRPFIRVLSNRKPAFVSRNQNLSRSSNNSLKSTSGTNRTGFKSSYSSRTPDQYQTPLKVSTDYSDEHNRASAERTRYVRETKMSNIVCVSAFTHHGHTKSLMNVIDIPTTINEESSRHNSLVPPLKITPVPSMDVIGEEGVCDFDTGEDVAPQQWIKLQPCALKDEARADVINTDDELS